MIWAGFTVVICVLNGAIGAVFFAHASALSFVAFLAGWSAPSGFLAGMFGAYLDERRRRRRRQRPEWVKIIYQGRTYFYRVKR